MGSQAVKLVKKKVKPYPFDANLEINAQKKPVEVVFLNHVGVIVRLKTQMVFVGEYYQVTFELPVSREFINTQARVLKTYDKAMDIKEKKVELLAELRFQDLTKEHKSRIVAFLASIGQEK